MNLCSISYTSAAVRLPTPEQLRTLLRNARARNEQEGVTGVLLYAEGTFHQYIEGRRTGLLRVYDAILRDPLHHHIFEMIREPIDRIEFPEWSMGYRGCDNVEGTASEVDLNALLANDSGALNAGRLLLHAFWARGLGARYQAALSNRPRHFPPNTVPG